MWEQSEEREDDEQKTTWRSLSGFPSATRGHEGSGIAHGETMAGQEIFSEVRGRVPLQHGGLELAGKRAPTTPYST